MGRGGGLVVSVLAFYSDDPSSIPAEVYNFFCKNIVEKNENKQKEAGVGPLLKKNIFRTDRGLDLLQLNCQSSFVLMLQICCLRVIKYRAEALVQWLWDETEGRGWFESQHHVLEGHFSH